MKNKLLYECIRISGTKWKQSGRCFSLQADEKRLTLKLSFTLLSLGFYHTFNCSWCTNPWRVPALSRQSVCSKDKKMNRETDGIIWNTMNSLHAIWMHLLFSGTERFTLSSLNSLKRSAALPSSSVCVARWGCQKRETWRIQENKIACDHRLLNTISWLHRRESES